MVISALRIYEKHKPAVILAVTMMTFHIFVRCENMMFYEVVFFSNDTDSFVLNVDESHPETNEDYCPPPSGDVLTSANSSSPSQGTPVFTWTEKQYYLFTGISEFITPIFATLFAGIYADRYGGHYSMLLGLVLSGLVATVTYLVTFHNEYVFVLMLIVRKIGQGMITASVWSLAGKWSFPEDRTVFVSILFIGQTLGEFIGALLNRSRIFWKTASYVASCVYYINAVWWWLLFRYKHVPESGKVTRFPWKKMIMSLTLYFLTCLILASTLLESLTQEQLISYADNVLWSHLLYPDWVIVLISSFSKIIALFLCGFISDFIISKGILSPSVLRRTLPIVLLILIYFVLVVVKHAGCNLQLVMGSCSVLHFVYAIFQTTVYTTALNAVPTLSGIAFGICISLSQLIDYLFRGYVIGAFHLEPRPKAWNVAFLLLVVLATVFTLPFILCGVKKLPSDNGVPQRNDVQSELNNSAENATQDTLKDDQKPSD